MGWDRQICPMDNPVNWTHNLPIERRNSSTERSPLLSSRCILNMKRLVTLTYKQTKTSNASQENDLGACQWFQGKTRIGTNMETPKSRITEWTEFQEYEVGTK